MWRNFSSAWLVSPANPRTSRSSEACRGLHQQHQQSPPTMTKATSKAWPLSPLTLSLSTLISTPQKQSKLSWNGQSNTTLNFTGLKRLTFSKFSISFSTTTFSVTYNDTHYKQIRDHLSGTLAILCMDRLERLHVHQQLRPQLSM